MSFARSLRVRLLLLILIPLALIASLLGVWRYSAALTTAQELFDRSLLAAALAVSRDVTVSGGDALSVRTRDLISQASGGQVLYHVEGPDRSHATGYAYPPVPPEPLPRLEGDRIIYSASHQGAEVVALRILERVQNDPLQGLATVTVWQRVSDRQAFAAALAAESAILIVALVLTVALIIWFGVNRGLKPLRDLEDAIAARSPDDLSRIRRQVPQEVRGIVSRLNALFEQVRLAMDVRETFLVNAAHQLRNPVAGMLALAEAAEATTSDAERAARISELTVAARRTARLTTQMLALERIKGKQFAQMGHVDLNRLASEVATRNADRVLTAGSAFEFVASDRPACVRGDEVMLAEALENLIDNALKHGGADVSRIEVSVANTGDRIALAVADDGRGLSPEEIPIALERFGQVHPSDGTGLGLAIVKEVATVHGGSVEVSRLDRGVSISIVLPA